MAVDIRIEIFAADLFQQLFKDPIAKYASKEIRPKLIQYSEETLKTSGCNKDVLEAVYFFRRVVRNTYNLSLIQYFDGQIKNHKDFDEEVRIFCRDIFFTYGNVFDKVFATAALVYDIGLKCIQSGDEAFIDLCPLSWAMCFDSEIKDEFYDKGGWDALFQKASAFTSAFEVCTMYLKSASDLPDTLDMVLVVSDYFRMVLLMVHQFEEYSSFTQDVWRPLLLQLARSVNKLIKLISMPNVPCKEITEVKFKITLYFTVLCNYSNMKKFLDFKRKPDYLVKLLSKLELSLQRSPDELKSLSPDCTKLFWIYSGLYSGLTLFEFTNTTLTDCILMELFACEEYSEDFDIEREREQLHTVLAQKGNVSQNISSYLFLACVNSHNDPVSSTSNFTNRASASVLATHSESASGPVIESLSGPVIESASGPVIESASGPVIESATGTVIESATGTVIEFSSDDDFDDSSSIFSVELFSDEETSYNGQKSYFKKSDPSQTLFFNLLGNVSAISGSTSEKSNLCPKSSKITSEIHDVSVTAEGSHKNSTTSSEFKQNSSTSTFEVSEKCFESANKMQDSDSLISRNSSNLNKSTDQNLDACFSELNISSDSPLYSPIKSQLSLVTKTYSRTAQRAPTITSVTDTFSKLLSTIGLDVRHPQASSELNPRNGNSCKYPNELRDNSKTSMVNVSSDCKNTSIVEDPPKSPSQMSIATDASSESECLIIEIDQNNDQKLFRIPKATSTKSETSSNGNSCSLGAGYEYNVSQTFSAMSISDELRKLCETSTAKPSCSSRPPISTSEAAHFVGVNPLIKPLQPITPPLPNEDNVSVKDQSLRTPKYEKDQDILYYRNRKSAPTIDEILVKAKRSFLMENSEKISTNKRTTSAIVASKSQPKQPIIYGDGVDQPSTSTGVFKSLSKPSATFSSKSQSKKRCKSPVAVDALKSFTNVDIKNEENEFISKLLILGMRGNFPERENST